ncbi:M57 family metalloprotease [Spirosoma montaniterrae]|uniref:Protease n=1 Tax=Spirosoma montaniterrae TaxID=1178516 RepID=A0A1P9X0E6_9BACT|nr:M57 family metalloprotease [Spirosoma montaniterrae]AQG81104.1 protease [Spirosoma montaniterrae]
MKTIFYLTSLAIGSVLYACQPTPVETAQPAARQEVPTTVKAKVRAMGFSTYNIQTVDDGYIVENDIFLDKKQLDLAQRKQAIRVGSGEQYHTTSLVNNLPRVIRISVANNLPQVYVDATIEAINRYNAQNLSLQFAYVRSGGDIRVLAAPANAPYLASAGFPSGGNPHNFVRVNNAFLGSTNDATRVAYIGSIMAHEFGHCIGFRHTDYMDRSYSCGGASPQDEGEPPIGAIQIPGTPAGPDPNSWMLACIGNNVNRPFNANDITALDYLY